MMQRKRVMNLARNKPYTDKVASIIGKENIILHLPLDDLSGNTARDASGNGRTGTYSNVTLGATDFVKGGRAPLFNGTTSFCNFYSASLNGAFTPGLFTVIVWGKVLNAGIWGDGSTDLLLRMLTDAQNFVQLDKLGANGSLRLLYTANNTGDNGSTVTPTTTDWFMAALTVDQANDNLNGYFNDAGAAATQTGIGVWAGALDATQCTLGSAGTTPATVWNGYLSNLIIAKNKLSAGQIAALRNA